MPSDNSKAVRLTLVSASPRRQELLTGLGLPFDVIPSHAAEHWNSTNPVQLAISNARRKIERSTMFGDRSRVLMGADTLIALPNRVFGKPAGRESAYRMLSALSGRSHDVITGVALSGPSAAPHTRYETNDAAAVTRVCFKSLTTAEITDYLGTNEWQGKAGAYAIQNQGGSLVKDISGEFDNVVGLPLDLIRELLATHFGHCRFL